MKLNDEQKAFLISCWARFARPQDMIAAFREEYGADLDHRQVNKYNPEGSSGSRLTRWLPLFDRVRNQFLKDVESIPIAHRGYRLRKLQGLLDKTLEGARPNIPLAASLLEQASKEAGGAFTNISKVEKDVTVKEPAPALDQNEKRALLVAAIEDALIQRSAGATDTRH